jgi:mono/diheme cytochrome c family protein
MAGRRPIAAFALSVVVASVALLGGCRTAAIPIPERPTTSDAQQLATRGESIVRNVAVCGHCHAADAKRDPDGPLSGGMEFRNWRIGVARASNLTNDSETGLGAWSEGEIVRALRNGVSRNGRLVNPVMPYEWFHRMSDDDAFAVAHYLKTLAPVRNHVTQSPNLWYRIGRLLLLRPKPALTSTAPPAGVTPEYGSYLANHVGLCADCHTQRVGIRSAPDRKRLFAGMAKPPEGFPANPSNLTPDVETGIGRWSEADFVKALRSGVTPDGRQLHPFMPWRQNGRMSDDDLRAIYVYLRTLPPIRNVVPRKSNATAR